MISLADRKVKVTLEAVVANYNSAMDSAAKKTRELGSESEKLAQTTAAFQTLGRASVVAGLAIGAGVAVAISKFADFDQAMSNVAATGDDARGSMDALRDAALDAGATTVFSATESANAIEELAKAGISAADILGGALAGSLDLAAAGGLDVATAAGIAATAMQQFGLEGDQASHVADLLAAGAGKAMGDVGDLSQALNQAGLVANSTGLSIEETTGALSAFASKGLLGSDAGTAFKSMLQRLTPQSNEAKKKMDELGISAFNTAGEFIGLESFSGNLQSSLKDLTTEQRNAALATIFGSDAVRAANVLYEEGAAGIGGWVDAVDDAGYAAETAATKLDNMKGDWEALTGAVDTALITMGSAADGPLRGFIQGLTGLVDGFNGLPEEAQQAAFWTAAVASAVLLAGGAYLIAVPKVAAYNAALATLGTTAQTTGRLLSAAGKGVGIAAGVAVAVTLASNALIDYAREIRGTDEAVARATTTSVGFLKSMELLGVTTDASADLVTRSLDAIGNGEWFGPIGTDIQTLRDSLVELDKGLVNLPLNDAVDKFQSWGDELGLTESQMETMLDELPGLRDAIQKHLAATGEAADGEAVLAFAMSETAEVTEVNEDALRGLNEQAGVTGDGIDGLADQIRNFGSATLSTRDAQRQFEQAFDDLTESISVNGATLDVAEQAGRDNQAALDDLATSALELAAATYEQTGSQEDANGVIADGRQRLIDMLGQFGITGDAAEAYADELGLIPGNITTAVDLVGASEAELMLNWLSRPREVVINARAVQGATSGVEFNGGRAGGGPIYGPGSGTSDTAGLYALSNGEHVLTAAEVAAAGGHSAIMAWRQQMKQGKFNYASGGPVGGGGGVSASPISLDGLSITGRLEIGGDGLARIIDGRIVQNNTDRTRSLEAGWRP